MEAFPGEFELRKGSLTERLGCRRELPLSSGHSPLAETNRINREQDDESELVANVQGTVGDAGGILPRGRDSGRASGGG